METNASLDNSAAHAGNARRRLAFTVYSALLIAVSIHFYRTPIYSMDSIQYMGNALLMEETNIVRIHHRVYNELNRSVPEMEREALLGHQLGAPADQNESRQQCAAEPSRFAQFLPCSRSGPV
jgi:hypothetical protein